MAKLKKGSAAAKAWGAKMRRLRRGTASPKRKKSNSVTKYKPRTKTMAKRKTKRRSVKRSPKILGVSASKIGAAMLYGAMRAKTSNMIAPYTSKLPLGNAADEAGMLLLTAAAKKYLFKKAGIMREAMTSGQIIELARIGDAAISGDLNIPFLNGALPNAASASGNIF